LSELLITSIIIIAIAQKRCVKDSSVTALQVFLREEANSKSLPHICFHPTHASSLGSPLSLFILPPPLLLAKTIFGSGALAGVFPFDDG
jgi:hypothetical protein